MTMGGWKFRSADAWLRQYHPQTGPFEDPYGLRMSVEAAYQVFREVFQAQRERTSESRLKATLKAQVRTPKQN